MELIQLLEKADRELGRLDMYSEYTPNSDIERFVHNNTYYFPELLKIAL